MARQGDKDRLGCTILAVVLLPFIVGLAYVLVMAVWRIGRALFTRGLPLLASGDAGAWKLVLFLSPLVATIAFIIWHAGRDGPSPVPGRRVYQGEDWVWQPDSQEFSGTRPGPGNPPTPKQGWDDRDGDDAGPGR